VPLTQFGRMGAALEMQIIAASSPQATGRVERNHGTHQDRLVKKLRRAGIADAAGANAFLEATYLPEHNARFAQPPTSAEDCHRRRPSRGVRDRACQLEESRVLSNDWGIRDDTRHVQVARPSPQAPAKSTVLVRETAAGAMELRYRGRLMPWTAIAAPVTPTAPAVRPRLSSAPHRPARPSADHPWRRATRAVDRERALSRVAPPCRACGRCRSRGRLERARRCVEHPRRVSTSSHRQNSVSRSGRNISISRRTGTFLFRLDTRFAVQLTAGSDSERLCLAVSLLLQEVRTL
jgi:hypothetical protein